MPTFDPDAVATGGGTTTGAYVKALTMHNGLGAVINLSNLDVSYNMKYKINVYLTNSASCVLYAAPAETTLNAATAVLLTAVNFPFYKFELWVETGSGACAYQYDAHTY